MVEALADEVAPIEHPPALDALELLLDDSLEPPLPEALEATEELLPPLEEEPPPPPDALLELLLELLEPPAG